MIASNMTLYVFVLVSYNSMGRGRCAAQASHAANLFTDRFIITPLMAGDKPDEDVMAWRDQAKGFGTQIVKAIRGTSRLCQTINVASAVGAKTGLVIDPEYAIQDGFESHIINDFVTGGFAFGDKDVLGPIFWQHPLLLNDPVRLADQFP